MVESGAIPAAGMISPTFPEQMGGPVEVRTRIGGRVQITASSPVIVSQRVTRNGHFSEVPGTNLPPLTPLAPPQLPGPPD